MFYQLVSLGILHRVFDHVSNSVMHHSILAVRGFFFGGGESFMYGKWPREGMDTAAND